MSESVDPNEIQDYVLNSDDPVSDLDLYEKFKLTSYEIIPVLENSDRTIFYLRTRNSDGVVDYRFSSDKVDDCWNPLRGLSTKFQYDDGGCEAAGMVNMKGDCVIRALSVVTRHMAESRARTGDTLEPSSYPRVCQELSEIATKMAADQAAEEFQYCLKFGKGISKSIYSPWLKARGWKRLDVKGNDPPTVREFINEMNPDEDKSIMVLSTESGRDGHLVAVVDGVIRDMQDCSDHLVDAAWAKVT